MPQSHSRSPHYHQKLDQNVPLSMMAAALKDWDEAPNTQRNAHQFQSPGREEAKQLNAFIQISIIKKLKQASLGASTQEHQQK